MAEDKKKYNYMENVLTELNGKFISLKDDDIRKNNQILQSVLSTMIDKMKEKDLLFKAMFTRVFYGGSYYDGLRVGKPEEFDLDLLLSLPLYAQPVLTTGDIPGFVHLKLEKYDSWMKQPEAMPAYRNFGNLLDDQRYLVTHKVLAWMEGIVQKTLNDFPKNGPKTILENQNGKFEVVVHKGGPALTLKITGAGDFKMDVDLVTCFVFRKDKWPKDGFLSNPVKSKTDFFIVPKKPKASGNVPVEKYWRLSFQEQERVLLDGKRTLKPTIKLLKKMRDISQHNCIASYYIKTVLLHMLETKDEEFWQNSLSYVFMTVLKEYQKEYIEKGKIPYYWNRSNNLIKGVKESHLGNINNRLKAIINDIERKTNEPTTVAKYLLNDTENATFMMNKLQLSASSYEDITERPSEPVMSKKTSKQETVCLSSSEQKQIIGLLKAATHKIDQCEQEIKQLREDLALKREEDAKHWREMTKTVTMVRQRGDELTKVEKPKDDLVDLLLAGKEALTKTANFHFK